MLTTMPSQNQLTEGERRAVRAALALALALRARALAWRWKHIWEHEGWLQSRRNVLCDPTKFLSSSRAKQSRKTVGSVDIYSILGGGGKFYDTT